MAYRALTQILLGLRAPVEPGELVPDTYLDLAGNEQPVDHERLVEIGAAEKARGKTPKPDEG